ncbi:MAG: methyltransferase [Pseudomonadota bacterium]
MKNHFEKDTRSALQSREHAQWIAYGPSVFQAARVLCSTGILAEVERSAKTGLTLEAVAERVSLPLYGVRVLMEAGLGLGLLLERDGRYTSTKTAWFLLHDDMTRAHMDFMQDVSYRGLYDLEASVRNGKPEGLKTFGDWPTIYHALAHLPEHVRKSWFTYDHFYSDEAFPAALPLVFRHKPKRLLDIGGNTGQWARECIKHDPNVEVTMFDLPGQLATAKTQFKDVAGAERVHFAEGNLLDPKLELPTAFDAVWMSQFLDCFSEKQIVSILERCRRALDTDGRVYILESFWDRQRYAVGAFCVQQLSLYFTALANGTSQMYRSSTFLACVAAAGFEVEQQHDGLGAHGASTLLVCRRKN